MNSNKIFMSLIYFSINIIMCVKLLTLKKQFLFILKSRAKKSKISQVSIL